MKKNKGITLIVLVITIVILFLLVGVTITTLTGENCSQILFFHHFQLNYKQELLP